MKKNAWKVVATSTLSVALLSGVFLGANNLVLGASSREEVTPNNSVENDVSYEKRNVSALEGVSVTQYHREAPGHITTPTENHLSIDEAAETIAQYIYDTYSVDLAGMKMGLAFSAASETAPVAHQLDGVETVWNGWVDDGIGTTIFHFLLDGETGEVLDLTNLALLSSEHSPETKMTFRDTELTVRDNTWIAAEANPHMNHTLEPHHLSIEEAALTAAEALYEEFGQSFEGMTFELIFWHGANGNQDFWNGFVIDDETEEFFFLMDARTGEIIDLNMNTPETPFLG